MNHLEREKNMLYATIRRIQAEARFAPGKPDGIGRGPEMYRALKAIDRLATDALRADAAGETTSLAEALAENEKLRRRQEQIASVVQKIKIELDNGFPGNVPDLLGYLL